MKLKKEDVKEGDWFVFSKYKFLSPIGGADAMQVVKCFDDYMVVNSADGFIEKPYEHFRHFVDPDAFFVENSCLIDDYYAAPYFEDHRTKLEIKHVLPYLPYDLIVEIDGRGRMLMHDINYCGDINYEQYNISEYKPVLRPISSIAEEEALELLKCAMPCSEQDVSKGSYSLAKDGSDLSFTTKDYCLCDYIVFIDNGTLGVECKYKTGGLSNHYPDIGGYEWLLANHFDIYGLTDKGLAVDKTELK